MSAKFLRRRLVADVVGGGPVAAKVPVLDEQVGRGDDPTVGRADDGRVVARAEQVVSAGVSPAVTRAIRPNSPTSATVMSIVLTRDGYPAPKS